MPPRPTPRTAYTIAALLAVLGVVVVYKVHSLGYRLADVLPLTSYRVTIGIQLDGHGSDVKVRTFLPSSDARQQIADEQNSSPAFHHTAEIGGLNRVATWASGNAPDDARIQYSFTVLPQAIRYDLDPDLPVPDAYPTSVAPYLAPEKDIQVDDPAIARTLADLHADRGSLTSRLRAIYGFTSGLGRRPFKGTTDALTALRLGEASCNGKSRLFVALARAAGIPARLVGGLILEEGAKRTSHQWVEVYLGGHWVPFCPTNHYFAELPERYLTLYYGDEALFKHTADVNFQYQFTTTAQLVPSPSAKASFRVLNVWALFERLRLPFSLLTTLLMLPVGALVVVLFRNVVGMPTFGTFLPALIAAAARETGALWGVVGLVVLLAVVSLFRWTLQRLDLLHSPSLAILLAVVVISLLATSLLAERAGLLRLARVTMFPIAVLAITAERFYLALSEQGPRRAAKELAGTLVVILACYAVMASLALQVLLIGFPEVLLAVVAANVYLGRWIGVRLSEYLRFRHVLLPRRAT